MEILRGLKERGKIMGKKRGNDYGRKKKEGKITGGKRMWERLRLKKEKQLWCEKERVIYYRGIRKRKDNG